MEADRRSAGSESGRSDRGVPSGGLLAWLPDVAALVVGAVGGARLEGPARWLCLGACVVAAASLGLRGLRSDAARPHGPLRSVVASLPALLLLAGILRTSGPAGDDPSAHAPDAPAIRLDEAPPAARECLASEAGQAYLDALHRHLDETWEAQAASDEAGFVVLGFLLDAEGGVRLSRVIDQSSDRFRAFGTEALARAVPFGPLRGELACLTGVELRATLDRTSVR